MERMKLNDFHPEVLRLFDHYVHGLVDRRGFLDGAAKYTVGGMTAAGLLELLRPNYALAQQVKKDDSRIKTESLEYQSPQGHGRIRGLFVRPASGAARLPGVIVVHENRGLNPYVEDVARRLGVAGFMAFAPDALTPLGGYPGTDEKGVEMQRSLDGAKIQEDFVAAALMLKGRSDSTGRIGVVGFCFGGGMSNTLAVRIPDLAAAAPYYGAAARTEDVPKIKAALQIHYAETDERINAAWPAYEAALKANKVRYEMHMYPGTSHGFHNDTTPRYNEAAAKLAWQRTTDFFTKHLRQS